MITGPVDRGLLVIALLGCLALLAPAFGQQLSTDAQRASVALIPGSLTGIGAMGQRGVRRFCDPRAVGLAQWRTAALTQMLSLDDAQQKALNGLASASAKALGMIAETCKSSAREKPDLATIELRLETLLQVLKTVRPSYDAFYASLDSNKKLRLDALGPRRRGWRW
jgi:hypothetical protein